MSPLYLLVGGINKMFSFKCVNSMGITNIPKRDFTIIRSNIPIGLTSGPLEPKPFRAGQLSPLPRLHLHTCN